MKIKKIILLVVISFASLSFSQNIKLKPDYNKIEKEISDKNSKYYYKTLFDRFIKSDTTLTSVENYYLYYGFSFDKKYNPYNRDDNKIKDLNATLSVEDKSKIDFNKALKISEEIIDKNPFDLRTYNTMLYILESKKDKPYFDKIMVKMNCIIDAILKSGDGKTEESPMCVIMISHEYDILNIIGLEFGGEQSLVKDSMDFLKLKDNKFNLKGLYFDVSPSFKYLEKSLK